MKQLQARVDIAPSVARRDVEGKLGAVSPIPLTHTQQRAWFLAQLDPLSTAYNEARAHRLVGPLNHAALKQALGCLIERHEMLRTTVSMVGHEPMQQLRHDMPLAFECTDLSSHPQGAREQDLQAALNAWCQEPFDLTLGPLVRFRVVRLADSEHVLLRTWHHIVTDGWSVGVFERELSLLYEALVSGRAAPLTALPIQYADYALWQRRWLAGPLLQQQLSYWKRQLADLSTLALPTDRPRPAMQSDRGAVLSVALPAQLAQRLRALARAEGTTLFMAGLAAFKVLLYRYSGTTDVAVGTPIAGRGRTELEGLIGFLANTLVLRTDLSGHLSFRALLARVRECALNAYTHQDLPFERLVEELAPARDLSRNPLFQVCFALHDAAGPGLTLHGLQVQPIELPSGHAKFDLSLDLRERDGTLHACLEFCTELFEHATIARMAEHFTVLLAAIVEDPEQCIDALPLMSAAERQRILVQFNDTARPYPKNVSLAALFQAQVQRSPQACALVHDATTLTYAQLNQQANRLAHHLIDLGVHPEVPVAICMHRSPDLIT
ncbi:MAG: condensation domain-containing protein, partial [Burkholderiales bacterium]